LRVFQVKILRALLIGLIIVVFAAVLANYLQTRRNRPANPQTASQILGPDLARSAENLEYSAHEKGVLKFRVRAKKLLDTRQGKSILQGIVATDLNPDGSVRTEIDSETGEYDGKEVLFSGNVRLRPGNNVEILMQSLRYSINDQQGTSDGPARLVSPQVEGTCRGIRFNNAQKRLELLHDLSFLIRRTAAKEDKSVAGEEYQLTAGQGFYSEQALLVQFTGNARLASAGGVLSGDRIDASFTADRRRLTSLTGLGRAAYESTDGGEVRTLRGERIDFGLAADSRTLESIHALGQAGFARKSPNIAQNLTAQELQLTLDPVSGKPRLIQSQRGVRYEYVLEGQKTEIGGEWLEALFAKGGDSLESLQVRDHASLKTSSDSGVTDDLKAQDIRISFAAMEGRSTPRNLQADKDVQWLSSALSKSEPGRSLTASSLTMRYSAAGDSLDSGEASGGVTLTALPETAAKERQLRRLQCDRTEFNFYPGKNRLRQLTGSGHVQLQYRTEDSVPKGTASEFQTSSSMLRAQFREADGGIDSISQAGGFSYRDGARTATSGTCDYSAANNKLVLRDHPKIDEPGFSTSGELIEHDRLAKVLTVRGNVRSVLEAGPGQSQGFVTASTGTRSSSIITANEMLYWNEQDKARYAGNVHLLSETNQLDAQTLEIANKGDRIDAGGEVRHLIFQLGDAGQSARRKDAQRNVAKKVESAAAAGPVLIRSERLQFERSRNILHYAGKVSLDSADTRIWAETMDIHFDAEGKRVERAVAIGGLRIVQPGREVRGHDGEYVIAEGKFVVTGSPAEMIDSSKGKSSARQLTFYTADDRIDWVR
jgi:LPS export ABC transporter protein LptC